MASQSTEQVEENLAYMREWTLAEHYLTDEKNVITSLRLIREHADSLLVKLSQDSPLDSKSLKLEFRIMYSLIVKLEMWRQQVYGDFDKVHLFKQKRNKGQR